MSKTMIKMIINLSRVMKRVRDRNATKRLILSKETTQLRKELAKLLLRVKQLFIKFKSPKQILNMLAKDIVTLIHLNVGASNGPMEVKKTSGSLSSKS